MHTMISLSGCITNEDGYIAWGRGTGDNTELMFIKSEREGGGLRLLRCMLKELLKYPPYYTVYGFTRTCNIKAQHFYTDCGFTLTVVQGVYLDGEAVVFSAPFKYLCDHHGIS